MLFWTYRQTATKKGKNELLLNHGIAAIWNYSHAPKPGPWRHSRYLGNGCFYRANHRGRNGQQKGAKMTDRLAKEINRLLAWTAALALIASALILALPISAAITYLLS